MDMKPGYSTITADELETILKEKLPKDSFDLVYESEYVILALNEEGLKQLVNLLK